MLDTPAIPRHDVITFGDLCVDLIMSGRDVVPQFGQVEKLVDDYSLEMGGSCGIFACQAARLGLRTAILGRVGADQFGKLITIRLRQCGVDTHHVRVDSALKTGLGIALCPIGDGTATDRAILTYIGTIDANTPEDVTDDILASARHVHHGSYYLQNRLRAGIPDIFARAHRMGLTVSLDTNWDPAELWGTELPAILPLVDVMMPNQQEALRLCGASSLDEAIARLHRMGARLVVVKRGKEGALASDGARVFHQSVTPVTGGDSIGAGDSFDAGFLAGWLRGLPLADCLRLGCACGRSVAGTVGGLEGQPSWNEINGVINGQQTVA